MSGAYEELLYLPHHVSPSRAQMRPGDRAAQFAPFAALSGYDDVVRETARLTQPQAELDESERERLDRKLQALLRRLPERPQVTLTYFQPDAAKSGGAYVTVRGTLRRLDPVTKALYLTDGTVIPAGMLADITDG